ncbi:MAG: Vitamin B12 dependent methionine synthase activation subunit [Lachnospiraceae bacterium]|nr:Vitamin B12 dependent methionine synthase activation subunit [Lachnospiraceae bacterium]
MEYPIKKFAVDAKEIILNRRESLRYLGYFGNNTGDGGVAGESRGFEAEAMVAACEPEVLEVIRPVACYGRFAIERKGDALLFPYGEVRSGDLSKNLEGCREIYLFAATIGTEFDRLIKRRSITDLAGAAILQAIGATAVENVCDRLNGYLEAEAKAEGRKLRPRYSPGYGDYGLENQKGIFQVLEPYRYIGISLTESLLMLPEKSVTAVIGIE